MQHSSMHFRADTVPGGSNMTESVRFHALERSGETADNVLAHGHAAATQPRPAPTSLFDLGQLEVEWEEEMGTLWAFITPHDRPNYTIGQLRDTMAWQTEAKSLFDGHGPPLNTLVLGSRVQGVFKLGEDLEMIADCS